MKKIIGGLIIFSFVVSFSQFILPPQASAASAINWSNPNQSGKNTYTFKVKDVINSDMAMSVVGCTGIVNRISNWMAKLSTAKKKLENAAKDRARALIIKTCRSGEKTATAAAGATPQMNLADVPQIAIDCKEVNNAKDQASIDQMIEDASAQQAKDTMEQCFNGIAIKLAKNQLTAITRSAVSWVNSGFGGNPLYVQNIVRTINNIEKNVIETGTSILLNPNNAYPYGSAFTRTMVDYNKSKSILGGAVNTLASLTSDLENFVSDSTSYFNDNRTPLQKSKDAMNAFQNDFSTGGWNAWIAMTQRDQNNPFGFAMTASELLTARATLESQNTKDEVAQNNGFLSQKKCISWQKYDDSGYPIEESSYNDETSNIEFKPVLTKNPGPNDKCVDWEVVTPGTLIKDKMANYLSSPERQLEIADTINKSLNAVFSMLVSKLFDGGLSGLSSEQFTSTEKNMNWVDTSNSSLSSTIGSNNNYTSNFDLTRDLGNTYIYDDVYKAGTWNAKINNTDPENKKLYPDIGPIRVDADGNAIPSQNTYYEVSTAGSTKLISAGYNGWSVGDRAFWDGSVWQNWKKDVVDPKTGQVVKTSPIKTRGVIQIQKDYIVAAKEILQVLPNVMPKLGELDYCLPGPNPSYKSNSSDAQTTFTDWAGTPSVTGRPGGFLGKTKLSFSLDGPGDQMYEAWKKTYSDTIGVWKYFTEVADTIHTATGINPPIGARPHFVASPWLLTSDYQPGPFYVAWINWLGTGSAKGASNPRVDAIDNTVLYINSFLFPGFYKEFDPMMDKLYFKNITSVYLPNEKDLNITPNPYYVPMAEEGYSLTKDMVTYNEDNQAAIAQYKADITQANTNISKLEEIRKEVGVIVKAAQARRDAKLLEILQNESTRNGTPLLTAAQYKAKYAECLDEENILYYDDSDIMSGGNGEERCNNGLDDDLDGLIDLKDPDCKEAVVSTCPPVVSGYYKMVSCQDGKTYQTGPKQSGGCGNPDGIQMGYRLQGASGNYYFVIGGPLTSSTPFTEVDSVTGQTTEIPIFDTSLETPSGVQAYGCPGSTLY